jgi:two-component system CheB/CheR fusion protein
LKILYVEDDPEVAESGRDLLRDMGAEVELFRNFDQARSHIETSGGAGIDVFLSDLALDNGHIGPELLMVLRRTPHGAQVPAVLLTAFGSTDHQMASLAVGFARHLVKPVAADALAHTLVQVTGR